jgi:hypothetical protein
MSAAPNLHALAYRDTVADRLSARAQRHLQAASDALSMALLSLAGDDNDRGDKWSRADAARNFLAEAVTELSRARIYNPRVRTHAVPVLLTIESAPDAELHRLHQIATRLLWQNHMHLPARLQAKPLAPEEEAQLAVVFAGLARNARIDRALRYKWAAMAVAVAAGGAAFGLPIVGAVAGMGALALAAARAIRDRALPEPTVRNALPPATP